MTAPSAVIFDCDGVLIDSEIISIRNDAAALATLGIELTFDEVVDRYVGRSEASIQQAVAEEFGVRPDEAFWTELRDQTRQDLAAEVSAVPGIQGLVAGLRLPYCLASSSTHERLRVALGTAGLLPLFGDELRFSAEDVPRGKPAPDLFLHAAATIGVPPAGCVVVEDSPYGVQAAVAAGMRPLGFLGGGHTNRAWGERLLAAGAADVAKDVDHLRVLLGV